MADEIWIFRGTEPVMWRIPCKVRCVEELRFHGKDRKARTYAHFEPAVTLLGVQRMALNNHFRSFPKKMRCLDGKWSFRHQYGDYAEEIAKMGATRATSDDPEDHLVWGPRPMAVGNLKRDDAERRAWLMDLLERGGGKTIEQLTFQWRAFCLHVAHTLINREAPVDCYYFKLHNCPLRVGWDAWEGGKPPKAPRHILRRVLTSNRVLAFDVEGGYCLRHIELEHTDEWWKLVRKSEKRIHNKGHEIYAASFQRSLQRFALTAWRIFCTRRAEMAQAYAMRVPHGHRGGFRFVPNPMARTMCGEIIKLGRPPDRANFNHLHGILQSIKKDLPRAYGLVPKVSDLRPEAQAVRQPAADGSGPAVDQPGNGEG